MTNSKPSPSKRPIPSGHVLAKAAIAKPSSNTRLAATISQAMEKKELIKRCTVGVYSLKTKDSSFGFPFVAVSDHFALLAQKQLLPISDCYKVGSFCTFNGKLETFSRPLLVLDNKVK